MLKYKYVKDMRIKKLKLYKVLILELPFKKVCFQITLKRVKIV